MALIKCRECGNEVSDSAKACPKCGAKPLQSNWWILILCLAILIPLGIYLLGKSDPKGEEKQHARDAIAMCWKQYERKSLDPAEKRFIASTCEMMERDYQKAYGSRP
jgi:hypothetical protein